MLLLTPGLLDARRRSTREGDLGALYDSLAGELEPLLQRDLYIPDAKALLSKAGGRCEKDGAQLEFDPASPQEHRCPVCATLYRGELHHRAWVMPYQLWLAERAAHSALFYALRGEQRHAALARAILAGYAERYLTYPNVDNVLGPTRPFFSTYLESIWLLQVCVATDLMRAAGDTVIHGTVVDRIVEPSRRLIAEFDEGMSNRQVWNNAALLAAAAVVGDDASVDERVNARSSGLTAHLSQALLRDATWYEGENYHQFALRGLWYGVTLAETRGLTLDAALRARFDRAFEVLYLTALPDFTIPSRKDSQYAVSLRQWRFAELAELGYARRESPLLAGALARTYEPGFPRGDTGRARSTADAERNGPETKLTRADLGWRALLHAVPDLPDATPRQPHSVLLEEQGLAVFRRTPDVYVSLDYGRYGGGHGHPDRLNLNLSVGAARILDDLGTGSYVDKSLHWYRSTLAHNAPLVNGRSQPESDGVLVAHDERGALGWTVSAVHWRDPGVRIERAVIVAPDYVIDELRWTADEDVCLDLPWHLDGECDVAFEPAALSGAGGLEDGFGFIKEARRTTTKAHQVMQMHAGPVEAWLTGDGDAQLFRADGPGQPAMRTRGFFVWRQTGRNGCVRAVIAWKAPGSVRFSENGVEVQTRDERHVHRRDGEGWHVELFALGARSSVDLAGFREVTEIPPPGPQPRGAIPIPRGWISMDLGEKNFRRSEVTWKEAGSPSGLVSLARSGVDSGVGVAVHVRATNQRFAPANAQNPYDNEHPDTMGAGVQLYLKTAEGRGAWMFVPEPGGAVRTRAIPDWRELAVTPKATWKEEPDGYQLYVDVPIGTRREFSLDVVVNEAPVGRERRRGQLVLSQSRGEFVYLRGDRHDEARLLPFRFES